MRPAHAIGLYYNHNGFYKVMLRPAVSININIMDVSKQSIGSSDCGLYAVAITTALAYGVDPVTMVFNHDDMRPFFIECFEKGELQLFPTTKTQDLVYAT